LQLRKAPVHAATLHTPLLHVELAFAAVHTFPQVPQLFTSVLLLISQPFAAMPSQFAKPALQVATAHVPAVHEGVPFAVLQVSPQVPQLPTDVSVLVSQPFVGLLSQLPKPALQDATPHAPPTQAAVPLVVVHAVPQAPQFPTLVARLVSQPLLASLSQSPKPALQVKPHAPAAQVLVLFGREGHTVPQAPQFAVSAARLVSQPLALLLSQSPNSVAHAV
jgi:hypothetical protein